MILTLGSLTNSALDFDESGAVSTELGGYQIIFQDSFENGFSNWDVVYGTPVASSYIAHSVEYSYKIDEYPEGIAHYLDSIYPEFMSEIYLWKYVRSDGNEIDLEMDKQITTEFIGGATVGPYSDEFVIAAVKSGKLYYFPSNYDGTFGSRSLIGDFGGSWPQMAIADFDNDKDFDFVAGFSYGNIYLFINDGFGKFIQYPVISGMYSNASVDDFATADFNNDGYYDFVMSYSQNNQYNNSLFLFINNHDYTFTSTMLEAEGETFTYGKDAGDFNEDGNMDFLVSDYNKCQVYLYLGDGSGGFTQQLAFNVPNSIPNSFAVAAGDFNNDGHLDAIAGQDDDGDPGQTWLFLGNGSGDFTYAGEAYDLNPLVESGFDYPGAGFADAFDFDGDGNVDVVAIDSLNIPSGRLWLIRGNGDGTFQTPVVVDTFEECTGGISAPPLTPEFSMRGSPSDSHYTDVNRMMKPLASSRIANAELLKDEVASWLEKAEGKELDVSEAESLIKKAHKLLTDAKEQYTSGNYIAANNLALEAIDLYQQAVDILLNLLE